MSQTKIVIETLRQNGMGTMVKNNQRKAKNFRWEYIILKQSPLLDEFLFLTSSSNNGSDVDDKPMTTIEKKKGKGGNNPKSNREVAKLKRYIRYVSSTTTTTTTITVLVAISSHSCVRKRIGSFMKEYVVIMKSGVMYPR